MASETSPDKIDIYENSPFGIAGLLEGYNDIKETSYRLEFGKVIQNIRKYQIYIKH
ncbi:hypothetical protein [Brachyspira hyodysenteriae]|uniref:hypothetical protein n=1 Tax=Brachyspira hyodysenteriae TaxID=159 RepID=UPI0022CDE59A|nr:hypothetical protein [Brachyspira hyodysenteriae]MCZ9889657.1 hypothetical protein [Brachyspira hyodysenteriae]